MAAAPAGAAGEAQQHHLEPGAFPVQCGLRGEHRRGGLSALAEVGRREAALAEVREHGLADDPVLNLPPVDGDRHLLSDVQPQVMQGG